MVLVSFKTLEDIKKLKVGEEIPIKNYVDPERGILELKGFGPYIPRDGKIILDNLIYDVSLVIKDIGTSFYKEEQAKLYKELGATRIDVEVINKDKPEQILGRGTLVCALKQEIPEGE